MSSLRQLQTISSLPSTAGDIVDLTPATAETSSVWLLLSEDGGLLRYDADSATASRLAEVRLPDEPENTVPFRDMTVRRRLHASGSGRFAAVVHDYGRYGQVIDLRTGQVTLRLDGGCHHCNTVPFALAFTEAAGRTLVVHRTAWNRLDLSDAETGDLLTPRKPGPGLAHMLDYFHGALAVSPSGTRIADDGWVWHPHGVPSVWNLRNWIAGKTWEAEDGATRKELEYRGYYWNNPQCWIDERRIAISGIGGIRSKTISAGVRIFDAVWRRELRELPEARGALFAASGTLYAAAPDGMESWNPDTGVRLGTVPGFVPTHHHTGAAELVSWEGSTLRRLRL